MRKWALGQKNFSVIIIHTYNFSFLFHVSLCIHFLTESYKVGNETTNILIWKTEPTSM